MNKIIYNNKEFNFSLNNSNQYEGKYYCEYNEIKLNINYFIYIDDNYYQCKANSDYSLGNLSEELPFLITIKNNQINIVTNISGNKHNIRLYEARNENLVMANRFGNKQVYGEYDNIVFNTEDSEKITYSKLPPLTGQEDNGKILGALDGIWQKMDAKFASSWNDLTDKPFEEKNYEEIGSNDFIINISDNKIAVKCFNYIPSKDEYFCCKYYRNDVIYIEEYQEDKIEYIIQDDVKTFFDRYNEVLICAQPVIITIDDHEINFTSTGTYLIISDYSENDVYRMELSYLKKLDDKFAPLTMATKEDIHNIQEAVGAIKQLPADWNADPNGTSVQRILNKPTNLATTSQINSLQSSINTTKSQLQSKIDANTKLINEHKQVQVKWDATEGLESIEGKPTDVTTETWVQNYILNNRSDWNVIDTLSPKFIHNKPMVFADWNSITQPTQIANMPQEFRHSQNITNAMLIDTPEGWIKKEIPKVTMTVTFEDDSVKVYSIFGSEVTE